MGAPHCLTRTLHFGFGAGWLSFLPGGEADFALLGCGNPGSDVGVAMGAGWHKVGTSTNESDLARTSCCYLGRIALQVPMS